MEVYREEKKKQLEYIRVLHEKLFVPVLMYGSETVIWKKFRIRVVQMDNLRGLVSIRMMIRILKAWIR